MMILPPNPREKVRRARGIIIAGVSMLLLLCCCSVGLFGGKRPDAGVQGKDFAESEKIAKRFYGGIRSGNYRLPYQATSESYRNGVAVDSFGVFADSVEEEV